MAKYRKEPVVIEAFRYGHEEWPEWFEQAGRLGEIGVCPAYCIIQTLEGEMRGNRGDWIIRGIKGEIYPCKDEIFEATYEVAL